MKIYLDKKNAINLCKGVCPPKFSFTKNGTALSTKEYIEKTKKGEFIVCYRGIDYYLK